MGQKIVFILLLLSLQFACKNKGRTNIAADPAALARTENSNRRYFADSFAMQMGSGQSLQDTMHDFLHFFKSRYPELHTPYASNPFPYAFEEEYIDTTRLDPAREWFRIIVNPFFRQPYCLVLETKAGRAYLTLKITNGLGGYKTGELLLTKRTILPEAYVHRIFNKLDSLGFWTLGIDDQGGCCDGDTWYLEGLDKGKYRHVWRWSPEHFGNSTTRCLAAIGDSLSETAGLATWLKSVEREAYALHGISRRANK